MKKRLVAVALLTALAVSAAGCGGVQGPNQGSPGTAAPAAPAPQPGPSQKPDPAPASGSAQVKFEVIKDTALPAEVRSWAGAEQPPTANAKARIGDYLYVLIQDGSRPTGGYGISIKQVTMTEQPEPTVQVFAEVTAPPPDAFVTMMISYPRAYLRVPYAATKPEPKLAVTVQREQAPKAESPKTESPSAPAAEAPASRPPAPTPQPSETNQVVTHQYEPLDARALPSSLAPWRQSTAEDPGGAAAFEGDFLYVMVSGGERPSGGFSVEIKNVQTKDGKVLVEALLHEPKPGQMVTMAITYPKAFVRVPLKGTGTPRVEVMWQ